MCLCKSAQDFHVVRLWRLSILWSALFARSSDFTPGPKYRTLTLYIGPGAIFSDGRTDCNDQKPKCDFTIKPCLQLQL